jgi:uncharacterized protein (TIGR03083 family)
MDHESRIEATRAAVRYLAERAATHGSTRVPNTPAWTVGEVATHVGWALWFWHRMMDCAPDDSTARERALAETPPFPPDIDPEEFDRRVEPVFAHLAADEHAACYVSMAGGPGTRGLWARHALSEIGVHRMDVEAALDEPHGITVAEAHDAVDYVAGYVLPAFRRMTGDDPGTLTLEPTGADTEVLGSISVASASRGEAVVRGPVREILLALWGRPHTAVDVRDGDPDIWRTWRELPGRSFQFASKD